MAGVSGAGEQFEGVMAEAQEGLLREQRIASRRRRVLLALHDLDLLRVLGREWVTVGDEGLEFGVLTDGQADALAGALERLGSGEPAPACCPGKGQLALDFEPVTAPVPLPVSASPHPAVFR